MKHFVNIVSSIAELDAFLEQPALRETAESSRSVLVQVFSGRTETQWIEGLLSSVRLLLPSAMVAGATSGGEIADGKVFSSATVVSVVCFASSLLHLHHCDGRRGRESDIGREIGKALSGIEHLQGVLLVASPILLDCARLLEGLESELPGVTLFGGGAGADKADEKAFVFSNEGLSETGVVAIGLQGETLQIDIDVFLGWEALGPSMTLTEVQDNRILTIDGKPAFNVYRRYLSIEPGEELFLLEFPLLLVRDGVTIARNPVSCDEHGAVTMVADVHSGEGARLGYLDIDTVAENVRGTYAVLRVFHPEAILLYSCVCRRYFLQQEIELETLPFQQLAPVAGFFTFGEFARNRDRLQLLNSSQVVVAMREGDSAAGREESDSDAYSEEDRMRTRHIRVTSRLFQFVSALTEEVEAANRLLQHRADHDALTGAFNRHRLSDDLRNELSRAKRHDHPLSLLMFDIDHFKRVNDQFGHAAGDYVLKKFAQTVWELLRKHDVMFRYGGEEFLLLLPEIDLSGAVAVAEKARAAIEALTLRFSSRALPEITVSFGAATAPQHGKTADELLEAVDAALYRAKQNGRNRVETAGDGD